MDLTGQSLEDKPTRERGPAYISLPGHALPGPRESHGPGPGRGWKDRELLSPLELVLSPSCVPSSKFICLGHDLLVCRPLPFSFHSNYHSRSDVNNARIPNRFPVRLKRMRRETPPPIPCRNCIWLSSSIYLTLFSSI